MANNNLENEKDIKWAIGLLGRKPRAPFVIKTRCSDGSPQVLLADSVFKEGGLWKPFPTFLWLVCPTLKLLAARLEQQGLVKEYSVKLMTDVEFRKEFDAGQKQICQLRIKMAQEILQAELPEHIHKVLSETTIAGSADVAGVKCLHAHLAQELAFGNNPIGREILARTGNCTSQHERIMA